ncbi:protocadherin-9 isoform X1 [Stegostoma tigrinum]|uniref:protocadherin-9 isoform X1 n=1 Tax=Stegostoma tigrinum TaxID=3053191 RepID=UPI00202B9DCA|nr:protocadherin-9 isoform X1 [Stegostoma tigrinum]
MDVRDFYLLFALVACLTVDCTLAQELVYTIQEELPENILIGSIPRDLNISAGGADLIYRLVSKAGEVPLLRVSSGTGDIYTGSQRVDRERLCAGESGSSECSFEIEVVILPNDYFRLVKVKLVVRDVNDNAPMFPSPVINISIPENTLPNSRFPIPSASDPDTGANGVQRYQLLDGQSVLGLDVVESPEGEKWPQLIVQRGLDREQKDTYVMKIKVQDGGEPPKSSTAILQVTVSDVNDNRPVFRESQLEVQLPEDSPLGTSVIQLHATDADVGSNAELRYLFSPQTPAAVRRYFALDPSLGLITVQRPLDREDVSLHKMTVLATDGSSSPARATVTVNVTDVNDNPPGIDIRYIISPVNGSVHLSEKDPVNTKIALITVSDRDTDVNGKVVCYIEKEVPFHLKAVYDNQYLLETSSFLDYESTNQYSFRIVASDAGKPSLNQSALVRVKLEDENDNPPVFSQPVIELAVPENNHRGLYLTTVSATDDDSGKNAEIVYQLGPNASFFDLDRKTGVLTASRVFDREEQERYIFTVTARDSGNPPLQSQAAVIVTVLDENDNNPKFTHNHFQFFVSENLPKYSTVGVITVTDLDAGANAEVMASVVGDNANFILDPLSGVIRSNVSFDREQQSSYTFEVKAVDRGRPVRTSIAKVTINVIDVNDNSPVVIYPPSNSSFKLVPLSAIPGSVVAEVFAVDVDTGMNAELKYSIVSGNNKGLFRIDPVTGNITLEEKPTTVDQGLHRLVVNISDLGYPKPLHTLVLVYLYVNDTVNNASYVYELIRRTMETPLDKNIGDGTQPWQNEDYLTIMIAIVAGAMVVIVVIFVTILVRCRQSSRFKTTQRNKQGAEWMSPNQECKQNKKKKRKKRKSPKSSLLNFVTIEESKPDDPAHEPINGTITLPAELEEQTIGRFDWGSTPPTTFKPNSPDLARHYKSGSPQPSFHLKPDTPISAKKHHVIQELPLDNTFVGGCDTLSKRSSTSSDHFSASECSSQGGFKTKGPLHTRQSHRRVTFHLPDGSQESCSDSGLGDHEPVSGGTLISHPLPLVQPQDEFYEQASPDKRTEADGNSDPNSMYTSSSSNNLSRISTGGKQTKMVSTVAKLQKVKFSTLAMQMLVKQFTRLQRIFLATNPKMHTSEGHQRGWDVITVKVNKISKVARTAEDCQKHINDLRLGARQKVAFNKKRGTVQHRDVAKQKVLTWEEEKVAPIVHLVKHGPDASSDSSDSGDCCTSKALTSEQQKTTEIMEEKMPTRHQEPRVGMEGAVTDKLQQASYGEQKEDCTGGQWKTAAYMKVPSSEKSEQRGTCPLETTGAVNSSIPSHSQSAHGEELCPICRRLDTLVSTVQRGFNHIHRDINTLQNTSQYRGARLSQNVMSLIGAMHTLVRLHHFSTLPRRDVAIQTSIMLTGRHLGENVGVASSDTTTVTSNNVTTLNNTGPTSSDSVMTSNETGVASSDTGVASNDTVIEVSVDPDGDSAESMSIEESSQNSSDSDW